MIPTFKFHGSKCRISKWILEDIHEKVDNYYELFAGRGNVFFRFASEKRFNKAFLNDKHMSYFLIALRDYTGDFNFIPKYIDRSIYESFMNGPLGFERDIAESVCAYNGAIYGTGCNNANNPTTTNGHNKERTILRMLKARELLQGVEITSFDFKDFLISLRLANNDLLYCDPPYIGTGKSSLVGSEIDHYELASIIKTVKCKVILSGYENEIYDSILTNFNKKMVSRASTGRNRGGGAGHTAIEYKWQNF